MDFYNVLYDSFLLLLSATPLFAPQTYSIGHSSFGAPHVGVKFQITHQWLKATSNKIHVAYCQVLTIVNDYQISYFVREQYYWAHYWLHSIRICVCLKITKYNVMTSFKYLGSLTLNQDSLIVHQNHVVKLDVIGIRCYLMSVRRNCLFLVQSPLQGIQDCQMDLEHQIND